MRQQAAQGWANKFCFRHDAIKSNV